MVRQLPLSFENPKKRQVKAPNIYVRDSGILHALLGIPDHTALTSHPKLGAVVGRLCHRADPLDHRRPERLFPGNARRSRARPLVFSRGRRLGFEFKYSDAPRTAKSMHVALTDLKIDHLCVVHPGQHTFPLTEQITATTLPDLAEILSS